MEPDSHALSGRQRQSKIKEQFEVARDQFLKEPCHGLVYDVVILQGLLSGRYRDIPKELHEELFGGSMNDLAWKLLLRPFRKGDDQHLFEVAKAVRKLNELNEDWPWEITTFEAFELLLEQFEKGAGPFPNYRDPVKKLAKHLRALYKAFKDRDDKGRDYIFTKVTEIPPTDRELFKGAMRTIREPQWDRIFSRCGLGLLWVNKGGRPTGSKNLHM